MFGSVRALQRMEGFMAKALRGEAVVHLPRVSNPPSLFELWRAHNLLAVQRVSQKAFIALP